MAGVQPKYDNTVVYLAKHMKIEKPNKPIIIPIGFDCGPSFSISLDIFNTDKNIPKKIKDRSEKNIFDLPFDTVVIKRVKPLIKFIYSEKNIESYLKETKQCGEKTKCNDLDVSFQHKYNYKDEDAFNNDMKKRILNLQVILTSSIQNIITNKLIFFRKSHSAEHHNPSHAYQYAAEAIDIDDAIELAKYLKSININNFQIILFLCCKKCYENIDKDKYVEMKDLGIVCFRTYRDNTESDPFELTQPRLFRDIAYALFTKMILGDIIYNKKPLVFKELYDYITQELRTSSNDSKTNPQKKAQYTKSLDEFTTQNEPLLPLYTTQPSLPNSPLPNPNPNPPLTLTTTSSGNCCSSQHALGTSSIAGGYSNHKKPNLTKKKKLLQKKNKSYNKSKKSKRKNSSRRKNRK